MAQRQFTVEHKPSGKKRMVVVPEVNENTGKPYTDDEIADILGKAARGISTTSPASDMTRYFGQGATRGMANIAGAPVDIMAGGLNLAGAGIERPVGGSQQLGELASRAGLTYPDVSQVPEQYRPFARAGETVGESIPAAALPFAGAAKAGVKPAQSALAPLIEPARTAPARTALAEGAAALGAGMGAGVAEQAFPGSTTARISGEIAGGVASPVALLAKTGSRLSSGLRSGLGQLRMALGSKEAIKQRAGDEVKMAVEGLGEGVESVAASLEKPSAVPMSSAAKSQSVALMALERKLVANSHKYGVEQAEALKGSIDELNSLIRVAEQSGDPQALRLAAEAKRNWYDAILQARVAQAQEAASEATGKAGPKQGRVEAGTRARTLLKEALSEARDTEKQFWSQVPKDTEIDALDNTRTAYQEIQDRLAPNQPLELPAWIETSLKQWGDGGATSGDLLKTRSAILAEMRRIEGAASPDWPLWGRMDVIQRGMMDDLAAADSDAATAREFSRALNKNFTHAQSVRSILSKHPGGGERVEPSLTLEKSLGPGEGPQRAVASREFDVAAGPIEGMGPEAATRAAARQAEMQAVQADKIRDLAVAATAKNGVFDPDSLKAWRSKNRELLTRYPEIDTSLRDAETATRVYGNRVKRLLEADKTARKRAAFAQVLDAGEMPEAVIGAAARGKTPYRDLANIFKLTVGKPEARAGAASSAWKYIFDNSTVTMGGQKFVSGAKLRQGLADNKSLMAAGKRYGLWTDTQIHNINRLAGDMIKLENFMKFAGSLDRVVSEPSAFLDLSARLVGANVGGHSLMSSASGASLVMAHAGSRYMRSLVEKIPMLKVEHVLQEAINDPQLMIELLRRPKSATAWQKASRRIEKKLSGVRPLEALGQAALTPPVGYKLQLAVPAGYEVEEQSQLSPPIQ